MNSISSKYKVSTINMSKKVYYFIFRKFKARVDFGVEKCVYDVSEERCIECCQSENRRLTSIIKFLEDYNRISYQLLNKKILFYHS